MLSRDELLIDLKGAVRLGQPEALDWALAPLGDWPAFAANARLAEEDVVGLLVPLGLVLAAPAVPPSYLRSLAEHPLAGSRALAAAAWARRYLQGLPADRKLLARLGSDRRDEVRWALRTVLRQYGREAPQRLAALLRTWLDCRASPRLQVLALESAAALPPEQALRLVSRCRQAKDEGVQAALGATLARIAVDGQPEAVLALLEAWAQAADAPHQAVLVALRRRWAGDGGRERVLAILDALEKHLGPRRALRRVRRMWEPEP